MSESLRQQLLKAGLVDERKLEAATKDKRKARTKTIRTAKHAGKDAARAAAKAQPKTRESAEAALRAKAERDRDLARARRIKEERKALREQVAQIVDLRKQPRKDGEIAYNFLDGKKVKRIYVTAAQRDGLSSGRLDIVRYGKGHEIVETAVAEKLRLLDPQIVVARRNQTLAEEEAAYADHPIPDDLDW
ncbi:MAG: DUF2058 family protein [Pseudomonadales bacterium]|jgi:uncharacterized protein YaiL (DUF2058 family)|nr:DUF2058 family protein [Pseudomonadales bacterium]